MIARLSPKYISGRLQYGGLPQLAQWVHLTEDPKCLEDQGPYTLICLHSNPKPRSALDHKQLSLKLMAIPTDVLPWHGCRHQAWLSPGTHSQPPLQHLAHHTITPPPLSSSCPHLPSHDPALALFYSPASHNAAINVDRPHKAPSRAPPPQTRCSHHPRPPRECLSALSSRRPAGAVRGRLNLTKSWPPMKGLRGAGTWDAGAHRGHTGHGGQGGG